MDDVKIFTYETPKTPATIGSRRIKFVAFPVEEGISWPMDDAAITIISDGSRETLSMSCTIEKSNMGIPQASTVTIFNLSEDTRNLLTKGVKAIIYIADPYTEEFQEVFAGGIFYSLTDRSGTDLQTKIYIIARLVDLMNSATTVSFVETSLVTILESLKKPLKIKRIKMMGFPSPRIVKSFCFMGMPMDMLNKLGFQEAFSWSIEDDNLLILADNKFTGNSVTFTPESGLISAVPILSGPMYEQSGVKVIAYPCPMLQCGDLVKLESRVNAKAVNRDNLRANNIVFNLSTYSNQWEMEVACYTCQSSPFKSS